MGISLKTHKMLWGRSGSRCAFPDCRKNLVEDDLTDEASIVGEEAHIVLAATGDEEYRAIKSRIQTGK